jgi:general secretion pathway protein C
VALGCGAFSAEQFQPLLKNAHGRNQQSSTSRATRVEVAHPKPGPDSIARTIDPTVAKLGTDDVGSKTPRNLILVDTAPGRNAREGTARLGTNPLNPQTYSAGAILLNGARLTEIYPDHVVLVRGGESVGLSVRGKGSASAYEQSSLLRVGGSESVSISAPAVSDPDPLTTAVTAYIRPNPVFSGEQIHGFSLDAGTDPRVFSKLGLRTGDVLTRVNGVGVTDGGQVIDMLEQLMGGAAIDATIERSGTIQQITLNGAGLADHQERD